MHTRYQRWHHYWLSNHLHWLAFALFVAGSTSAYGYVLEKQQYGWVPVVWAQTSSSSYYVDNKTGSNCSDTGSGSLAQPFCTIRKGGATAIAGDTVYIRSGTYEEDTTSCGSANCGAFGNSNGGSAGKPITYKGYPGDSKPIINGSATRYAAIIRTSYITLDSLVITNGYRDVFLAGGAADYFTLRNSEIYGLNAESSSCNNNGAILADNGGTEGLLIENNIIHDSFASFGDSGCAAGGMVFYQTNNFIIRNNHVYNEPGGIFLKHSDTNGKIYNNIVHDVDEGIYVFAEPQNVEIFGNIIYNYTATGLGARMSSSGYLPDQNVTYYNNVVIGNGGTANKHSFYQVVSNSTKVFNNIFYHGNRGSCVAGNESGELMNRPGSSVTNFSEGNNLFYHPTDNRHFCWNGTRYSLAGWQAYWDGAGGNPANGAGSLESDPLFVSSDPANSNFLRLSSTSPAIDAGTVIAGIHCPVSDDSNPNQTDCVHWRGAAPDLGAYEYGVTVPDTTPPAAVLNLSIQ